MLWKANAGVDAPSVLLVLMLTIHSTLGRQAAATLAAAMVTLALLTFLCVLWAAYQYVLSKGYRGYWAALLILGPVVLVAMFRAGLKLPCGENRDVTLLAYVVIYFSGPLVLMLLPGRTGSRIG